MAATARPTIDSALQADRPVFLLEYIPSSHDPHDRNDNWMKNLQSVLSAFSVQTWRLDKPIDSLPFFDRVQFVLIWNAPLRDLSRLPALRAVFVRGSGVDHLQPHTNLRPNVFLVRLIDDHAIVHLARYVLHWILHVQLRMNEYCMASAAGIWKPLPFAPLMSTSEGDTDNNKFEIGIMGYGMLGRRTVQLLGDTGFNKVRVWRQTKTNDVEAIAFFTDFTDFTRGLHVLVNFVPLTEQTRGIVDSEAISRLARGAAIISVGRGSTLDMRSVLNALDDGHLAFAVLDTFENEPLPPDSPLWKHPRAIITPHIAGRTFSETSVRIIADNIRRVLDDEQPFPTVPH